MKNTLSSIAMLAALIPAASFADTAVPAPEAKNPHTFTGNMSVVSDYRFRGLSQTSLHPAVQGGFDYAHEKGIYLGTWASSVSGNQYPGATLEWDFYGGYKFEPVKDVGLDVGLIHIYYPGGKSTPQTTTFASRAGTTTSPNTTEVYAGLSSQWFSVKYNHTLSNSLFGLDAGTVGTLADINGNNAYNTPNTGTRGSGYLDLGANFEIADKLTLNLHVGHQSVKHYSNFSYADYKIGLTREIAGYSLAAAVVGTNAKDAWWYAQTSGQVGSTSRTKIGEAGLVVSASKAF